MADLKAKEYQRFEDIKHTTEDGIEFWYARELAPVLDYVQWRNFSKVIPLSIFGFVVFYPKAPIYIILNFALFNFLWVSLIL